ncbi:40-kDa huntingtin-associated protein-like [Anneissia japonica]|uniref:40-kDa huntingtin-associated protein-like n=1 Tax=Anneissia japonica TaxID=1529436 RepID=UPI001425A220|nr:40-kDa huntingtin-associated protein-like [Anneissia japonica]
MERDADFLGRYRSISGKLKRRFLRKPNVAEAIGQFNALSKVLEVQECSQYAGLCCLAMARCEHTLANAPGESSALIDAAQHFLEAENIDQSTSCPNFEEHLSAAVNCYGHAVKVHLEQKQPALAASLCLRLANSLKGLNKAGEASLHYQRAAHLQYQSPLDCLHSLNQVAACKIELCDYDAALTVLTEMEYLARERMTVGLGGRPVGAFMDILGNCEISRVLLLMLLKPTPQRIRPEHAQTLERYSWESSEDTTPDCLSETMFLLLQSLVMACQSRDIEALTALQQDLWPLLSSTHIHLLHLIIKTLTNPPVLSMEET